MTRHRYRIVRKPPALPTLPPEPDASGERRAFLLLLGVIFVLLLAVGSLLLFGSPLVDGPR